MAKGNILKQVWQGEDLPEVKTVIFLDKDSAYLFGIVIVVSITLVLIANKIIKEA